MSIVISRTKYPSIPLLLFALVFLASAVGQAPVNPADVLRRDFPVLSNRVVENQPADFVIAVDRSGSMKPFWSTVKDGTLSFVDAIPDGDYVSIVGFGTGAENLVVPRPMNAETRVALRREIESLPEPADKNTDIGLGIQKVLDELNRPNGNKLKFVFILTDFEHEPPRGSPFAGQFSANDPTWSRLAERRSNEQADKNVQSYALLLPLGPGVGKHLALGRAVFPGLQSLSVSSAMLGPWFERRKAEIARDKLKAQVDFESVRSPVTVTEIRQVGTQLVAVAVLATERVVDTKAITGFQIEGLKVENLEVQLIPVKSESTRFLFNTENQTDAINIPIAEIRDPGRIIGESFNGRVSFKIKGMQEVGPADEIAKLDLQSNREFELDIKDQNVSAKTGLFQIWMIASAAAVLLVLVYVVWRYFRPEYISGQITIAGTGQPHTFTRAQRRRSLTIGNVNLGHESIPVENVVWKIEIRAFGSRERKRGIYAKIDKATATIDDGRERAVLSSFDWRGLPANGTIHVGDGRTIIHFSAMG